ncbi:MAG: hypothetical protein ACXW03_08845 [Methylobacter sp.]
MMKIKTISLFGTMLLSFFAGSNAVAAPECYQWSGRFSKERFVLDIEEHSDLSRNQRAYSVHGKHLGVCGYGTIAAVTGTIVRATPPLPVTGAHMGLRTHSVGAAIDELDGPPVFLCKEVTLDCTLDQSVMPKTWSCVGRNEWDVVLPGGPRGSPQITLTKLSPQDGSCKVFEDIGEEVPTPDPEDVFSGVFGMPQQQ